MTQDNHSGKGVENIVAHVNEQATKQCGMVMPLAAIDNCSAEHWQEVYEIVSEAADDAGFAFSMVSQGTGSEVIHQRIVQNLHDCEMIVCDVSGKNPNVMLELGMRLTFNKPVVVIKDKETDFSFDTSPIEHLLYPRSLHFQQIRKFKAELSEKITSLYEASLKSDYKSFLSNFGKYEVSSLETEQIPQMDAVMRKLEEIEKQVSLGSTLSIMNQVMKSNTMCVRGVQSKIKRFRDNLTKEYSLSKAVMTVNGKDHVHIETDENLSAEIDDVREIAAKNGVKISWIR